MTNIEDLFTVDSHEAGAEMQVQDENGNKLKMFITVAGPDSKVFRKVKVKLRTKLLKGGENVDIEAIRAKALADVTLGWRGFKSKGKKLEFSIEKVEQLYNCAPYVMDQLDQFVNKRLNFTKG